MPSEIDTLIEIEISLHLAGKIGALKHTSRELSEKIRKSLTTAGYDIVSANVKGEIARLTEQRDTSHGIAQKCFNEREQAKHDLSEATARIATLEAELSGLRALLNTPHTADWLEAVPLEAAHQIERWGSEHDAGKTPLDWFWLIGYLAQKVVNAADHGDIEKAKHHTISTGAAMLNWWCQICGYASRMRPGIDKPEEIHDAA